MHRVYAIDNIQQHIKHIQTLKGFSMWHHSFTTTLSHQKVCEAVKSFSFPLKLSPDVVCSCFDTQRTTNQNKAAERWGFTQQLLSVSLWTEVEDSLTSTG